MKILDSDHWIALLRGTLDLRGWVAADEELAITAISVGELVYGAERSARPDEKLLELDALHSLSKLFSRHNGSSPIACPAGQRKTSLPPFKTP
jgi:predicted nucleic acid-binding protein